MSSQSGLSFSLIHQWRTDTGFTSECFIFFTFICRLCVNHEIINITWTLQFRYKVFKLFPFRYVCVCEEEEEAGTLKRKKNIFLLPLFLAPGTVWQWGPQREGLPEDHPAQDLREIPGITSLHQKADQQYFSEVRLNAAGNSELCLFSVLLCCHSPANPTPSTPTLKWFSSARV